MKNNNTNENQNMKSITQNDKNYIESMIQRVISTREPLGGALAGVGDIYRTLFNNDVFYSMRGCRAISDIMFDSRYDFSDYLDSEISSIIQNIGSLESYALEKKEGERVEVLVKSRMRDMKKPDKVVVKALEGMRVRYEIVDALEVALIKYMHGECLLGSTSTGGVYLITDAGLYTFRLPKSIKNRALDLPAHITTVHEKNEWVKSLYKNESITCMLGTRWYTDEYRLLKYNNEGVNRYD